MFDKSIYKCLLVVVASCCWITLVGCSSNEIEPVGVEVLDQLEVGQTTRAETIALLGQPDWVRDQSDNQTEWLCYESYRFKQSALHSMLRRLSFREPEECSAVNMIYNQEGILSEVTTGN
ncbi:MAG: hypothetical protein JW936_07910 [Sedimentisphaerales bacterium]|nr:hypothetical protein [Sedimentisphaerales bacterium]